MQGSTMPMAAASENLVLVNQLPQPTRPPNSYDMILETPSTAYPQREDNIVGHDPQQSNDQYCNIHHVVPPTLVAKEEEEGGRKFALVDKLVDKVLDKYEKLPDNFRDQINLEAMLAKERDTQDKSQSASTTTSRGLRQPVEVEISEKEKLGRFKIRTVVAEEVVKEDEKK